MLVNTLNILDLFSRFLATVFILSRQYMDVLIGLLLHQTYPQLTLFKNLLKLV